MIENHLQIGNGFYTIPDISWILGLPKSKVRFWLNKYWDGELGANFKKQYSWSVANTKAVSFHTLIEFYVLYVIAESGVKTRKILNAHQELANEFGTLFPFAQKHILENIKSDGQHIYFQVDDTIISLDGSNQFNLNFIQIFFKNLDFDDEFLASRFWPLGHDKKIVVDPKRQFGHPVVGSTNIFPETLYNLYKSGESKEFIAFTYEISEQEVKDAITFCKAA